MIYLCAYFFCLTCVSPEDYKFQESCFVFHWTLSIQSSRQQYFLNKCRLRGTGSGSKGGKKIYWAEDTIDEFSLAQHVTGDSLSLLTHGNICIVGFFSDYKMYT